METSPLDHRAGIGQATAKNNQQQEISSLKSPGSRRLIKSDRHSGSGGVSTFVQVDVKLTHRNFQPVSHGFDDPEIGLVGDHARDVMRGDAATLENNSRRAHHGSDGLLIGLATVHVERVEFLVDVLHAGRAGAAAAGHVKNIGEVAITAHVGRDNATRTRAVSEDRRASSVAEENAGVAVDPIYDAAEFVGADDEDRLIRSAGDELVRDLEAVKKSGTRGADIQARGVFCANEPLDMAGGGREEIVRRDGADKNEIDLLGFHPRVFHGGLSSFRSHVAREFRIGCKSALTDSSALDDPLIRGFDHRFEVGVGEHAIGHITARADDGGGSAKLRRDVAQGLFHEVAASPRRCGC